MKAASVPGPRVVYLTLDENEARRVVGAIRHSLPQASGDTAILSEVAAHISEAIPALSISGFPIKF